VNSIFDLYWMYQVREIFKAAERGDVEELEAYKAAGGDINAWEPVNKLSLFQIALLMHNIEFARTVATSEGFNPFHVDAFGRSALDIAHETGNSTLENLVMDHLRLDGD